MTALRAGMEPSLQVFCAQRETQLAFFFDFLADHLACYPRHFDPDVSGILVIERDIARIKAFDQISVDEQERRLRTGCMNDLPSNSKDFVLIRNKGARRRVPKDFQDRCLQTLSNSEVLFRRSRNPAVLLNGSRGTDLPPVQIHCRLSKPRHETDFPPAESA